MTDRCARCGVMGEDRRTLWMACFYAMNELRSVPFELVAVHGRMAERDGTTKYGDVKWQRPYYSREDDDEYNKDSRNPAHFYPFYTLRVCKGCRGSWMGAIEKWFRERDTDAQNSYNNDARYEPANLQELVAKLEELRYQATDLKETADATLREVESNLQSRYNDDGSDRP